MTSNTLVGLLVTCSVVAGAYAYSRNRPTTCSNNSPVATWTDCSGTISYPNGDLLTGEFREGSVAGTATYKFASGDEYVGEFSSLSVSGKGTYFYSNGGKYVGEFVNGQFDGQGSLYYTNGDTYIGKFKNDQLNGKGVISYANGSKQAGEFKDGQRLGQGSAGLPSRTFSLVENGGVFELPVKFNDVIVLDAIIDSGASDVSIPKDVFNTLYRTGTISDDDYIGTRTYTIADGSKSNHAVFRIKSISIGAITVNDVVGSITDSLSADILLGQTFLQKFKTVALEKERKTVTFYPYH